VYYNSEASPHNKSLASFRMIQLLEKLGHQCFNCFPLRRSWLPRYIQIDIMILYQQILKRVWIIFVDKLGLWESAVDLNIKAFRNQ
ncbi:hypothetical protein F4703DRAFT_1745260, partial [Phycomyces blakesleeanus]